MKTVFIDFDNTIAESNKKIIDILNLKYNISKTERDLQDYNFASIVPISILEKVQLFESDEFFTELELKEGFIDFYNKYKDVLDIVVVSIGSKANLNKKSEWLRANISNDIKFQGITSTDEGKSSINMQDGLQIDDCTSSLKTNALIKVLYKSGNNYDWQQDFTNTDIIVVNSWDEISEIIDFYLEYDYKTLVRLGDDDCEEDNTI